MSIRISNPLKTYVAPKMNKISLSLKNNICDSRDLYMARWERTNGNPCREIDDVQMYLPNGQYISKKTGKIKG